MRVPSIVVLCLIGVGCDKVDVEVQQPYGPVTPDEAMVYADQVSHLIRGEDMRAVVAELASDAYEGRGPGSAGDLKAREWIAAQLAETGIAPARVRATSSRSGWWASLRICRRRGRFRPASRWRRERNSSPTWAIRHLKLHSPTPNSCSWALASRRRSMSGRLQVPGHARQGARDAEQ